MHPYSSIDTTAAWKKLRFVLSVRSDFHMIDILSIAVYVFVNRVSMSFSVDETLRPRKVNLSTIFRRVPFGVVKLNDTEFMCFKPKWHHILD